MDLKRQQVEELRELFDFFDTEKKGKITLVSFSTVLHQMGYQISSVILQDRLRILSRSGDEALSFEDFLVAYSLLTQDFSSDREMKEIFNMLDDNDDGLIEVRKLTTVFSALLPNLSRQDIVSMIQRGFISDEENNVREFYQEGLVNYKQFAEFFYTP
jgi:calcium-binding protein CML